MLSPLEKAETFDMPLRLPWLTLFLVATHCFLFPSESYQDRIAQAYELLRPIGKSYFHFGNLFCIKTESPSAAHDL